MIELKSPAEIEKMRCAGRVTAEILAAVCEKARPGVTTGELDREAERLIGKAGARSAFKNYRVGDVIFPKVLCASINDEVVHGIPSDERVLEAGDVVGLDFGVECDGYYGDCAVTLMIDEVDDESRRLLEVTERSLRAGIERLQPGLRLGDVGAAVQGIAEAEGFSVVRSFVGHGIGRALHEDPQVPNFGRTGRGRTLKAGMVLAVEPMINAGQAGITVAGDGWTAITADGRRSAHFEHTVALTERGPEVLTSV